MFSSLTAFMLGLEFATKYTGVYLRLLWLTPRVWQRQETRDSKAEQSAQGPYRKNQKSSDSPITVNPYILSRRFRGNLNKNDI